MSFNYSKLLGKIIEEYGTQYNFALALGLSERSLSLKLNNKVRWKDTDIKKSCSRPLLSRSGCICKILRDWF